MNCKCGGETKIVNSRRKEGNIWRRRECLECGERFTTWETNDNFHKQVKQMDYMREKMLNIAHHIQRILGEVS